MISANQQELARLPPQSAVFPQFFAVRLKCRNAPVFVCVVVCLCKKERRRESCLLNDLS